MRRFFVNEIAGDTARLTGEDFQHAARVLRVKPGDIMTLCDGRGTDYEARVAALESDAVRCDVLAARPSCSEPACRVSVFQCLPKAGKLEIVIQKCTELGAAAFVPVQSRYCVPEPKDFDKRLTRLCRVAYEAAKQAQRGRVPEVAPILPLGRIDPGAFDLFLIAYENERTQTLKSVLRAAPSKERVGFLIGPEGGLAPEEVEALAAKGAKSVSLGPRILRTETAGAALLAQLLYEVEA